MNEMKERYNQLQRESISINKYNDLDKRCKEQNRTLTAIYILTENVLKKMRKFDNYIAEEKQRDLYRSEIELVVMMELLEQYIK
jgi:hypothetical protein